jgi:hypothetical protein
MHLGDSANRSDAIIVGSHLEWSSTTTSECASVLLIASELISNVLDKLTRVKIERLDLAYSSTQATSQAA